MNSETFTLNTGARIPVIGLGVYKAQKGTVTREAVRIALQAAYRHFDTARIYNNEEDVGAAIRSTDLTREDLFVTTKLWNEDQGYDKTLRAFDASLKRLGLDYVDLYLIHWPVPGLRVESWRALESISASGKARAIGVSNYMSHHIAELLQYSRVVPAVNQIEVTPFLQQREVRHLCAEHGIAVEAYSPLTKGLRLNHPVIVDLAVRVDRSPAQVLIRWSLQHGMIVLPKSVHRKRIEENLSVFDFSLNDQQMATLDALEEGLVTGWDPRGVA
jgi:methylglyoxal/glyoxal reductase